MQTQAINYILGSDSITVFVQGKSYTINKQAKTFELVLAGVKANDVEKVIQAVNIKESITTALNQNSELVRLEDDKIFYANREVTGVIASRIFEVIRLGLDVTPMVKFLENLMANPSKRATDEGFGFIEACSLPITPDGCFLAYKRVNDDYKDVHSNTVLNKPYDLFTAEDISYIDYKQGKKNEVTVEIQQELTTVSMPRNLVNEDKDQTCSEGLHFCSYDYLKHFSGSRVVVLKINPADIVSIPSDYNNSKGRCSKYQVVGEIELENNLPLRELQEGYCDKYDTYEHADDTDTEFEEIDEEELEEHQASVLQSCSELNSVALNAIRYDLDNGISLTALARHWNKSRRTIARIRDYESPYNN